MHKPSILQRGQGKDLLFLHGYGASKESFLPQIDYFSKSYRVTAIDFPPFGNAPPLTAAWDVADYADYLLNITARLSLQTPAVLAHSFGARVAVKAESKYRCFEKLVLTGAAGIILPRKIGYYARVWSYKTVKKIAPSYAEKRFGSAEYKKLSPLQRESYKKIVNEDLRAEAEKIEIPTLLIYGRQDKTTPVKMGQIYNEHIPFSRLRVMQHCGHFAFLDDPFAFNRLMEEFLEREP